MPDYGRNPYLGSGGGSYRPQRQVYRRRGRRFGPSPLSVLLIGVAVVAVAAVGISLAGGGKAAKPTLAPTENPTPAPIFAMPTGPRTPAPTNPPTPQPTQPPAQEATATPASAQTQGAAPVSTAATGYFTSGGVQVDYGNMLYQSADLYVKVTNVNENGVNYYVADCRAKDPNRLFTALATDQYPVKSEEVASVMAKRKGAVIAINGDYFGSADSGTPDTKHRNGKGIVIRNGQLDRSAPWYDIAAVFKDGTMKTYSKTDITAEQLMADGCWQAWNFGPMLMDGNGNALSSDKIKARPPLYNPVNPRTGIGYIEPNHFVLVVVDGQRPDSNGNIIGNSKGMTTTEFAQLFQSLGCKSAYNLDGGGSSVMVFMGKVISHPCDEGIDNQRPMSDIIYFGESETDQANIDRINSQQ